MIMMTTFIIMILHFPSLHLVVLVGDARQKGSFINAEEGHVPAAFASFGTYSVLQFSRKLA
jgi:hypothetical protein